MKHLSKNDSLLMQPHFVALWRSNAVNGSINNWRWRGLADILFTIFNDWPT